MTVAVGFRRVAAFDPEQYHVTEDAAGVSYAATMDGKTRRQLAECIRESAPKPRAIDDLVINPAYIDLHVNLGRGDSGAMADWADVPHRAVRLFNDRHAGRFEELQLDGGYSGLYRPDGATTPEQFVEVHTGRPPEAHDPVFEYVNDDDEPPTGPARSMRWTVRVLHGTDDSPEDAAGLVVKDSPGFEWDINGVRGTVMDHVDWPGTHSEALRRVTVYDDYTAAVIHWGAFAAPQAYARGVRRAMLRYNNQRDAEVSASGGAVTRPKLQIQESPVYVGAIETGAVDDYLAGLPDLDGEPIEPVPEPKPRTGHWERWPAVGPARGWPMTSPYERLSDLAEECQPDTDPADLDDDEVMDVLTATARLVGLLEWSELAAAEIERAREDPEVEFSNTAVPDLREMSVEQAGAFRKRLRRLRAIADAADAEDPAPETDTSSYRVDDELR